MPEPEVLPLTADAEIDALVPKLSGLEVIAVDTEFNRTSTYRPQLCLVQLAAGPDSALIDMLSEANYTGLRQLLAADPGLKLFHAGKQDLEALQLTFGWLPNRILDTQIAAGLLGHPAQAGYAKMVEKLLGLQLDKAATRTDWSQRPLTEAQLRYAREDVVYLLLLYDQLREQLLAAGRYEWALEDSAALLDPTLYVVEPAEAWRRLGGLARLPLPALARVRALASWRENRAQTIDRPRQWVLADKALLNIARADPPDAAALTRVPDVPPAVARRQAQQLLEALANGNAALKTDATDVQREPRKEAPDPDALKALAKLVGNRAAHLGLAPEILATRKELAGLLRGEQEQRVTGGWRREVIGNELLAAV